MYKLKWINEEDGGALEGVFPNLFEARMAAWLVASELDEGDTIQAWENNVEDDSEFEIDEFTLLATASAEWPVELFGAPHATITLNESGWDTGMAFIDYCRQARQHGDDPSEYSMHENQFRFVSLDYAKFDPFWNDESLADWPENLAVWMYQG